MTSPSTNTQGVLATGWAAVWPALRPALWTAAFTFIAIFGGALTGWLADVSGWLSGIDGPEAQEFPDPGVLGEAAVAAIAAAAAGLVNFLIRWLQVLTGKGEVPTYAPQP